MEKNISAGASSSFSKDETDTIALIRIMATMGVLAVHLNQRVELPGIFGQVASCGADGVKVYFLLTGYLVMHSWQSRKSTKDYWRKRLGRTLPLEWITADPFAIPRAILMLEYLVPSTVSYEYCAMELWGTIAIFMMFYLAIPLIAKWVKSLNGAFVCFGIIMAITMILPSLYGLIYGHFAPSAVIGTMSAYLAVSFPYFGAGVLIYFGKREQKPGKLLCYLLFIEAACNLYPLFNMDGRVQWLILLTGILLCYPLHFSETSDAKKKSVLRKMITPPGGGYLHKLDHLGMGVVVSQVLCFDAAQWICNSMSWGKKPLVLLMFFLPYIVAFFLYHLVEVPGKKFIYTLMR